MQYATVLAALSAAGLSAAFPTYPTYPLGNGTNSTVDLTNPFLGKNYFANSFYARELEETIAAFLAQNDTLNAARTRTVQKIGTFVWVTSVSGLVNIPNTVKEARAEQEKTGKKQI